MPRWAKEGLKTDVIFVDPPRKGLTPEFIDAAVETSPKKIVYISCNPATQVRDLQLFKEKGYKFDEVAPVDMFPQTPHVESVVVLRMIEVKDNETHIKKLPTLLDWDKLIKKIPVEDVEIDENGHYDSKKHPDFHDWIVNG